MEKKLLTFCEKHLDILTVGVITLLGLWIRYGLRDLTNSDVDFCLLPWYDEIRDGGGIKALGKQVGNYNMLYQTLIALFTYLPIKPLYAYKLFSVLFDFCLAVTVGRVAYRWGGMQKRGGIFAYAAVVLSPPVVLNSSAWGQCDSIYVFFGLMALIMLCREKFVPAFLFLGVSFSFKLQAVFLLPLFLFVYFWQKRYSILYFPLIPVVMCVLNLTGVFMGRSFLDIFTIYFDQTNEYNAMVINYPSIWLFFQENYRPDAYWYLRKPGILVTVAVLFLLMLVFILKKIEWNPRNLVYIAFLLSYACVLFLPVMHERYGYLYEILAIVILIWKRETIMLLVPMYCLTAMTYANYLFGMDTPASGGMAVVNLIVYLGYLYLLLKEMTKGQGRVSCS